ncbi:ACN9-domain-containing protein [Coprinellus micaceus]|uniref:Succinate dehydrogenase assembly factor 3 n=1 Tax=Coprinellus micaceus TaxID=71717 RepID=A0A4Y7SB81_COPMI|nr:ACN9-domain-containing protein [Coprinellus micaceus]TEB18568.1 ACN9-domain-containing protein [Coprinellus micaceus]
MRVTLLKLAESLSHKALSDASASLLPPTPLYRRILRSHRHLPREMRSLGDDYVKAEFRRHEKVTNPVHIMGFLSQWKMYLDEMPAGPEGAGYRGRKLDATKFEKMSNEQLGQLYEFMQATKELYPPVKPAQS